MPVRKRKSRLCSKDADSGCVVKPSAEPTTKPSVTNRKVLNLLHKQGVIVAPDEQERFVSFLNGSLRRRSVVKQRWKLNRLKGDDILRLILNARNADDFDEAIWRSFLAAHFGRPSANPAIKHQLESASLLLCGFGPEPVWTWNRVRTHRKSFRNWLYDHAQELQSLSFGNHRKYESQKPKLLWPVFESFIDLTSKHGGPKALVTLDPDDDKENSFQTLYRRLRELHRFGRTGRFDFLVLLLELKLISAEPKSCYLLGATGPKKGAVQLWGNRGIGELDRLAAELAEQLNISPIIVEDALCNWQK